MIRQCCAALLVVASAAAYRAPSALSRSHCASRLACSTRGPARTAVIAFGGDDKFLEASLDADGFGAKLGTPLGKVALQGLIVITAAAGWGIAPSVRPVVKGVFAAAGAAGGFVARKRLIAMRRQAASGVLAQLLSRKGINNVGLEEAWALAKSYGVTEEEFSALLGSLLGTYLSACIRSTVTKTTELSDLLTLRRTFKLGFDVTGDAVFEVASRFYSEARAYFEDSEEHEAKGKLDKLVFLADRLLADDPSEEGFRYERMRICKKFGFDDKDWSSRVERVGAPFYRDLLATVAKDPSAVAESDLLAVGKQLGLSDASTSAMKLEELRRSVGNALEASGSKLTRAQVEKIKAMVVSLGFSEAQYREVIEAAVAPAYTKFVTDAMAELEAAEVDISAKMLGKLAVRQQELEISVAGATKLEMAAARGIAGKQVQAALQALRMQNTRDVAASLQRLVGFSARLVSLVRAAGKAAPDASADTILATYLDAKSRACSASEAVQLYRVYTLNCLEGSKVEPAALAEMAQLRALLGVSSEDAVRAFEDSASPIYMGKLNQYATMDEFPEGATAELAALAQSLSLPAATTLKARVEFYRKRLVDKAGNGKIPSEADDRVLEGLRGFLELTDGDVEAAHIATCSASYAASVKEVMDSKGIILDEYWEGLETLQARLRLPKEVAEELYLGEAKRNLKGFGEVAVAAMMDSMKKEMEAKDGDTKSRASMEARAAVVAEAGKILAFCEDARLLVRIPDGEEIAKVSLRGTMDPKSLKEFYKQYLIECFQGEGEQSDKLFARAPLLGQVLGLSPEDVRTIQTDLGSIIYKNAIMKALTERGAVSDDDRAFLVSIQEALGMDDKLCDRLLFEMKKMRVATMVERMFDASNIAPDAVANVRTTAEQLGLELANEVGIAPVRLLRMLRCEMEAAIEAGEVRAGDTSRLGELTESYGLPQSAVTKELEQCIERRCAGHVLQAATALRRGQADLVISETEMLLRFNALNPYKVVSTAVQQNEFEDIFLRYQASCMKDGPLSDDDKARLSVLRTAFGLGDVTA